MTHLHAGFAHADITPQGPMDLVGYEYRFESLSPGSSGVHDPLQARVLLLDDGTSRMVIASVDLCTIPTRFANLLRNDIASVASTTPQRVALSATHTHSGPLAVDVCDTASTFFIRAGSDCSEEKRYGQLVRKALLDATANAANLIYPVELWFSEMPLGIGYCRRTLHNGILAHCWNPQESPDLPVVQSPDPTCTVITLRQVNGPRQYILWSLGVHPVVMGKTSKLVSADYPGRACACIEKLIPGSKAIFALGAAADIHPLISTQENADLVNLIGDTAGSFVASTIHALRKIQGPLQIEAQTLQWKFGTTSTEISLMRLGDLQVAQMPFELFANLGLQLRTGASKPFLISTVCNGWEGYVPDREAFALGGYEVDLAREQGLVAGDGERLVEEIKRALVSW